MFAWKDRAAIVGVGETAYVRGPGSGMTDLGLQLQAAQRAIADAGLSNSQIDGLIAPIAGGKAEDFIVNLGLKDLRYAVTSHSGGAACVAALASAALAVAAGLATSVLIPAGMNGFSGARSMQRSVAYQADYAIAHAVNNYYAPFGLIGAVTHYALPATRYVQTYGIRPEQTGAIAIAMRKHAQLNPQAIMRNRPITMEDYLDSPMISTPFRLFDCCLESDGGAAIVVTSAERAGDMRQPPVYIMGVAEGRPYPVDELTNRKDFLGIGLTSAAPRAFAMAGVDPRDMDFAEIYDSFTVNVLRELEEAGFCERGEAGSFVENGRIELGGELPVNTHGGLLSEAHVQGMNHVVEAVRQLRGSAGERQVQGAELGAVTGMGGGWGTSALAILRR